MLGNKILLAAIIFPSDGIVLDKRPKAWVLATQAPKIEGGQLYGGGSTITMQAPSWMQSKLPGGAELTCVIALSVLC